MPSVLIELGFTTNSAEEDYLNSSEGQDAMSTAIARSFGAYKARRERGLSPAQPNTTGSTEGQGQEVAAPAPPPAPTVVFAIQLSVSGLKKSTAEAPFNAVEDVWIKPDGRLYRYLQGHYLTLDDAKAALAGVQKKGFADAFIVAYKGDDRISPAEAERLRQ